MGLPRVVVAMSGGVDSSVAAYLLRQAGHEVVGVTMCLGISSPDGAGCCGAEAIADARRVCDRLEIPHYVMDFGAAFREKVITHFANEYGNGRTPNPCIECNRHLKFDLLLKKARAMGFDCLATGHYARIVAADNTCLLARPKDRRKDQSYFLCCIQKELLPSILFPLGEYTKQEVRQMARSAGLPVAEKSESQDVCFSRGNDHSRILENNGVHLNPGDIVDETGKVLGRHSGACRYTIGQRKGLGISAPHPLYVIGIDAQRNRVVVGPREKLGARGLVADSLNMFITDLPKTGVCGQIRYAHRCSPCSVQIDGEDMRVVFEQVQDAITPGQSVVIYHGDIVAASGIIRDVIGVDASGISSCS